MRDKKTLHLHQVRQRQRGLSLVELMIAMTLGLFLIWGVTQSFLTSRQVYDTQQALSRIQENTRMAQEFIAFDIRNAGDYGCAAGDSFLSGAADIRNLNAAACAVSGTTGINMIADDTIIDDEFKYTVYGFDNVASAPPAAFAIAIGATAIGSLLPPPKANTDVLMVHVAEEIGVLAGSIPGPAPGPVPPALQAAIPSVTLAMPLKKAVGVTDRIAVSDCATTKIFANDGAAPNDTTITLSGNYCATAAFQTGASVRKLSTIYYYVADNGRGGFSLYRAVGNNVIAGGAEELLEGVDDMQLQFGIDNVGNGDGVIDVYKSANEMGGAAPATAAEWESAWNGWDWVASIPGPPVVPAHADYSLVRAVRYSLLMNAGTPNLLNEAQKVNFNGVVLTGGVAGGPGDRSLRQVVTSTVGIRSRIK